ncbi:MAG: LysR family transcriptional regulator [Bdellovibrionales bacterium]|nr:LysR family transcriptional regulator [Bdellovibrionales bacterium]
MNLLSWELSIISRAVNFPNLSAASRRIGLSQPQLSRIVQKVEADLGLLLLDRSVKRNSAWTTQALQLGEASRKLFRSFEGEIQQLANPLTRKSLHIGTLEGLTEIAIRITQQCFDQGGIDRIELDIYDLHGLEERFLMGRLDLILTARESSFLKSSYLKVLGYQKMKRVETSPKYQLYSSFEFHRALEQETARKKRTQKSTSAQPESLKLLDKSKTKVLISNSLNLRQSWLEKYGAMGNFPEPNVTPHSSTDRSPVALIGQPSLGETLWDIIAATKIEGTPR